MQSTNIRQFEFAGFIVLRGVIPPEIVEDVYNRSILLKKKYEHREGEIRHNGSGSFWKGLELASTLDPNLWKSYTHQFMYDIAKEFLETEPYLFNDQIVVKMPGESFGFDPHWDNQYGPDPEGARENKFKTINCAWSLVDMDENNGQLRALHKSLNTWHDIPTEQGDIVIMDGNTLHASSQNSSNSPRPLYACVYSSKPLGDFQKGFYNEKFSESLQNY